MCACAVQPDDPPAHPSAQGPGEFGSSGPPLVTIGAGGGSFLVVPLKMRRAWRRSLGAQAIAYRTFLRVEPRLRASCHVSRAPCLDCGGPCIRCMRVRNAHAFWPFSARSPRVHSRSRVPFERRVGAGDKRALSFAGIFSRPPALFLMRGRLSRSVPAAGLLGCPDKGASCLAAQPSRARHCESIVAFRHVSLHGRAYLPAVVHRIVHQRIA